MSLLSYPYREKPRTAQAQKTHDAVVLKTSAIRPARRKDYFTKTTVVAPRDEPTPVFDQFMREIMGWHVPPEHCKCAACTTSEGKPQDERIKLHQTEVDKLVDYLLRLTDMH
jgi:hypothetical protein